MPLPPVSVPSWLTQWFQTHGIVLWGAADLRGFSTPQDKTGQRFPRALSFIIAMNPLVMAAIQQGPDQSYADEYGTVNRRLNLLSETLAAELRGHDYRAQPLAPSDRTDIAGIKGDFPHKTAATRAGLGWVGKHCQLITRDYGPWVRLGTVFTDMELPCGPPLERSFCGDCTRCVGACPAKALKGCAWHPGLPREAILDAWECDRWKKEHYLDYQRGHVCGICSAVCPYGLKALTRAVAAGLSGSLVPKLQIGNAGTEAPASRATWVSGGVHKSDEAGASKQVGSQARAWEPALASFKRSRSSQPHENEHPEN